MTSHDVTLEWTDGSTQTIAVDENESVLDAAQRAGARLPYDCREGTCITCVGRLLALEGEEGADESAEDGTERPPHAADAFTYRRAPAALTDEEQADGYVLLCIAHPQSDCRIEVGPRVRAEVGDSPWA
ncbi:2Fe-2S iron-sulfur cluster binding domain-containing protein [Haloterrigena sp. SYSU A121-1]|uniref:2Fe-2S iron-sulfur cluster binding domain-containing protein n=1 Tax=Haloterrigena gelatinilytica TaxID=2741724 RepID=A0A8J8GH97_9EURY|nr:2Fe-2S iron-sulfur cluster-binding protein [Haloterrigena gelatinilytica]NUB89959.1 2Fe-2S iron-sulfur cluster binding domain-containing protein [Haloterrigena gelatinilytica]